MHSYFVSPFFLYFFGSKYGIKVTSLWPKVFTKLLKCMTTPKPTKFARKME